MAAYSLYIKPSAGREIDGVGSKKDRRRIVGRIWELVEDPRSIGCEKLAGHDDCYRIRVGDYRAVYSIDDARREIVILKVGHRRKSIGKGRSHPRSGEISPAHHGAPFLDEFPEWDRRALR